MRAYCETGMLPKRLLGQLKREIMVLERKTGKQFGSRENPLLVSVRSGAATSMPGMMDTVLNLGITEEVLAGFSDRGESAFGSVLCERFMKGWRETVSKEESIPIPNDPWEQLTCALVAVIKSWDNPRARVYREHHGISHTLGTAVNVQAMVFGNRDEHSGTGVVFSHNVNTGEHVLYGEFLPCAQGEEVVAGVRTPLAIEFLKSSNGRVYEELHAATNLLATHEQSMVEVEFTIESGVLYFLQHRKTKASLEARITSFVHDIWKGTKARESVYSYVSPEEVEQVIRTKRFNPQAFEVALARGEWRGIAASPGVAQGVIVYTSEEAVKRAGNGEQVILFRQDTCPDDMPGMLVANGIITRNGGATCHAAVVARSLGKPAIVGALGDVRLDGSISMDGSTGIAVSGLVPMCEITLKKEVSLFVKWFRKVQFPKPRYDPSWALKGTPAHIGHILCNVYLLELMAHEAKGTVLSYEVEQLRCKVYTQTAELFLCYLVYAVAAEMRHITWSELSGYEAVGGDGDSTDDRYNFTLPWAENADEEKIRWYLTAAAKAFRVTDKSTSIGGIPWAVIAETALGFLDGTLNHTVFVDRVFDLQHNTGRVFNKHVMVQNIGSTSIEFMLNDKKHAKTYSELSRRWRFQYSHYVLDPEIVKLGIKGSQLNIWR